MEKPNKIKLGCSRLRISLPVFVALKHGLFKKHGIEVEPTFYDTAQPLIKDLLEGGLDVGGYIALPITYDAIIACRKKLYYMTAMVEDKAHPISMLLQPIKGTLTHLKELKGKRIGLLPTYAYHAWLQVLLKKHNIHEKDVELINIPPAMQISALKEGKVDALFTNDPVATHAINQGIARPIVDENPVLTHIHSPLIFGSFNASKAWADKHQETFKNLAIVLDEAIDLIHQDQAIAKQAMLDYLPTAYQKDVPAYPNAHYIKTTEAPLNTFQKMEEKYLQLGILKQTPRSVWFGCNWDKNGEIGTSLKVENLSFSYKNKDIFKDVNFNVQPGEILGILAGNGSGKTTLLRTLAGLLTPQKGAITLPKVRKKHTQVSYIPQNYKKSFFNWATLEENITLLHQEGNPLNLKKIMADMGITLDLSLKPDACSGGMLQQASLLRAFAVQPDVLFADEPFSALDVNTVAHVRRAFSKFVRERNIASVLILHNIADIVDVCDRILVINKAPFTTQQKHTTAHTAKIFTNDRLLDVLGQHKPFTVEDLLTEVLKKNAHT